MEQALITLGRVAGVTATAIVGPDECHLGDAPPYFDPDLFVAVAQEFTALIDTVEALDLSADIDNLMVNSDIGGIWFRRIESWLLIVLTAEEAKPAILTVALNTALNQLKRGLISRGLIAAPSTTSTGSFPALGHPNTTNTGGFPAVGRGSVPSSQGHIPGQITATGGFAALSRPLSQTPSAPPPPAPPPGPPEERLLGMPFQRHLLRCAQQSLGEQALPLFREIFARLQVTPQTIRVRELAPLLNEIEVHINSLEARRAFRSAAQNYPI